MIELKVGNKGPPKAPKKHSTVRTVARARFNNQDVVAGVIVGTETNPAYIHSAHATYVQSAHAISIGLIL